MEINAQIEAPRGGEIPYSAPLSPYQHGFRSKHCCDSQLISFTQEVYDNLGNGNQTDIIVMDFSKAFDKVDHNKLIYKLSALGIHPLAGNTMDQLFLTMSHPKSTNRWMHVGHFTRNILGPCLFLAYINYLPNSVKSKVRLFADDTIMYLTVKTSTDANILQNDL